MGLSVPAVFGATDAQAGLLGPKVGAFITEIGAQLEPLASILTRYGIDKAQFKYMMANPTFRAAIKEAHRTFASLANISDRIRLKAQLMVEMGLPHLYDIMVNQAQPASARVSAFAQVKGLTGLEKPDNPAPLQQFRMQINIAGNPVQINASGGGGATDTQLSVNGAPVTDDPSPAVRPIGYRAVEAIQDAVTNAAARAAADMRNIASCEGDVAPEQPSSLPATWRSGMAAPIGSLGERHASPPPITFGKRFAGAGRTPADNDGWPVG